MNHITVLGTAAESVNICEDRDLFQLFVKNKLSPVGVGVLEAYKVNGREELYKVVDDMFAKNKAMIIRPSYTIGGAGMAILRDKDDLDIYFERLDHQAVIKDDEIYFVDEFLEDAIEFDADYVADGGDCVMWAVSEQVERTGVHSGDCGCIFPTINFNDPSHGVDSFDWIGKLIAKELGVIGCMNVQYAVEKNTNAIFIIEVNPRGSRSLPLANKWLGLNAVTVATKILMGGSLKEFLPEEFIKKPYVERIEGFYSLAKAPLFPFERFGSEPYLAPEMKSTGESASIASNPYAAYAEALIGVNQFPKKDMKRMYVSLSDKDKKFNKQFFLELKEYCYYCLRTGIDFKIYATEGTYDAWVDADNEFLQRFEMLEKLEGFIEKSFLETIDIFVCTPTMKRKERLGAYIRKFASGNGIPLCMTLATGSMLMDCYMRYYYTDYKVEVISLQELHDKHKRLMGIENHD